ncbi:hypothetical protein [Microbispora sp. GKU 823]|nr:hypothetical protein [Microbispora sp. GKU 823]
MCGAGPALPPFDMPARATVLAAVSVQIRDLVSPAVRHRTRPFGGPTPG